MKKTCLYIGIAITLIAIIFVSVLLVKGKTYNVQNPIATIEIEGYEKTIKVELDPQSAPNAVANFIKLANNGFYTDFKMHIEEDKILGDESMEMAKMSNIVDYTQSDYVYGIKGDFLSNGTENLIRHKKGVITMERDDYSFLGLTEEGYNSANCNFALLIEDIESYDGYYASFGRIIEGMDVLDAIAATRIEEKEDEEQEDNEKDSEVNIIKVKSISVETYGIDYGIPEVVNFETTRTTVDNLYKQYFGGDSSSITIE